MAIALPAEQMVTLRDGTPVRVRPIRPDDAPRLIEFHSRLSMNTTRLRFFTPMKRLSATFAEHLCTVEFKKRCAFVISPLDSDSIHAVGRYEAESRYSAEVAFVVEDSFQGKGIGTILLDRLVEHARTKGFDRLTAVVLCENLNMLTLFRESPYSPEITMQSECAFVKMNIAAPEPAVAVPKRRPRSLAPVPRLRTAEE
ncbi:MAG: GNAT family N-acetyltransferase [Dehalococcoidia bacterium]|nr:GNAT family N-acetyltransferase [Dehalococcoidia bacterium]